MKKIMLYRVYSNCLFFLFILSAVQTSFAQVSESTMLSQQTVLNVLWVVKTNDTYMTSSNLNEFATVSGSQINMKSGFEMVGQAYYIPEGSNSNRHLVYRDINKENDWHLTSVNPLGEPPYTTEGPLGYAWKLNNSPNGTTQLYRGYQSETGKHVLLSPLSITGFSGYEREQFYGYYGYPRFLTNSKSELFELSGSNLKIKSNLIAGGSIWEYWHNGKQYLSNSDYGREIQSSLGGGIGVEALPTEGGDYFSGDNGAFFHGSPILSYKNEINTNGKGVIQSTRAIPMEWLFQKWNNGYQPDIESWSGNLNNPVIYKDWYIGKNITFDDPGIKFGPDDSRLTQQIAKYETVFYTPIDLGEEVSIEIPTGYLSSDFTKFFWVDAAKDNLDEGLTPVAQFDKETNGVSKSGLIGGAVIATSDYKHAMGIYGTPSSEGGDVSYFTLWNFLPSTAKWSAVHNGIKSGEHIYTTYIITGTLDEVRVAMRNLYIYGYR